MVDVVIGKRCHGKVAVVVSLLPPEVDFALALRRLHKVLR